MKYKETTLTFSGLGQALSTQARTTRLTPYLRVTRTSHESLEDWDAFWRIYSGAIGNFHIKQSDEDYFISGDDAQEIDEPAGSPPLQDRRGALSGVDHVKAHAFLTDYIIRANARFGVGHDLHLKQIDYVVHLHGILVSLLADILNCDWFSQVVKMGEILETVELYHRSLIVDALSREVVLDYREFMNGISSLCTPPNVDCTVSPADVDLDNIPFGEPWGFVSCSSSEKFDTRMGEASSMFYHVEK